MIRFLGSNVWTNGASSAFLFLKTNWKDTYQGLRQKVHSEWVGVGEKSRKRSAFTERQGTDIISGSTCRNGVKLIKRGCSQYVENEGQLMMIVPSREKRLA